MHSEKKVVFAEKDDTAKKITYFDKTFSQNFVTFDFSNLYEKNNEHAVLSKGSGRFLGFNFSNFLGFGRKKSETTYSIEPGSCCRNCVNTVVILGLEFQNGEWEPCNCD